MAWETTVFNRPTCGRIVRTRGATVQAFPAEADDRLDNVTYSRTEHGPVRSLEEAADLRGLPPRSIIKTIVVRRSEDDYVFVLVPGDRVIDWSKLREALGERRLSMPDAEEALAVTGYVRGTITPFGARRELPVVADSLIEGTTVSIGGGGHGQSLTLSGDDLIRSVEALVADVTTEKEPMGTE
jgi:Cys-tRNA(Pro) deacylase